MHVFHASLFAAILAAQFTSPLHAALRSTLCASGHSGRSRLLGFVSRSLLLSRG